MQATHLRLGASRTLFLFDAEYYGQQPMHAFFLQDLHMLTSFKSTWPMYLVCHYIPDEELPRILS